MLFGFEHAAESFERVNVAPARRDYGLTRLARLCLAHSSNSNANILSRRRAARLAR